MDLVTKNVHLNRKKGEVVSQITLENDFNVSDQKPDVEEIITEHCELKIDALKIQNGKTEIKGRLGASALYTSTDGSAPVSEMDMEIPFSEPVNMDMLEDGDTVRLDYVIDNIRINVINSRKISVKAIITFIIDAETIYDMNMAVAPETDENAEYIKKQLKIMQLVLKKKDVFRIKEEVDISGGKPNIGKLLWKSTDIRNCQTKLMDNKIHISGELILFAIYEAEDENSPIQWIDSTATFSGTIDADGCNEEMIQDIDISIAEMNIDIKPDYDGEQRIFEVDAVLDLDIRIYEEDSIDVMEDIFSPAVDLMPIKQPACGENLVMKNISKCRVTDKIKVDGNNGKILQVCNVNGKVCMDSITKADDGLEMEGAVEVCLLYISADDNNPFCSARGVIPFSHKAEVKGIGENSVYDVKYNLEQLSQMMTGENEVEIKAVVSMDIMVRNKVNEPVIVDVQEKEIDMERIKNMPGIIIYNIQKGDNLWSVAKRFHTSTASVKKMNGMNSDNVHVGDSLIIIKELDNFR